MSFRDSHRDLPTRLSIQIVLLDQVRLLHVLFLWNDLLDEEWVWEHYTSHFFLVQMEDVQSLL